MSEDGDLGGGVETRTHVEARSTLTRSSFPQPLRRDRWKRGSRRRGRPGVLDNAAPLGAHLEEAVLLASELNELHLFPTAPLLMLGGDGSWRDLLVLLGDTHD